MTLFDADEKTLRMRHRGDVVEAYIAELKDHPPVDSCAGEGTRADASRRRIAEKDVARLFAALARRGWTVHFVPLETPGEKGKP